MDTIIRINHRQSTWMAVTILNSSAILIMPQEAISLSGHDAWVANAVPLLYCLWIALAFAWLATWYPGKNLFEIVFIAFGKWIGGIANLLIFYQIWTIFLRDQRLFADFVNTTLLRRTPIEIIILLMLLVIVYYASSGLEVIARVNDLFVPVMFSATILFAISLFNQISLENLQPLFTSKPLNIWTSGVLNIGWFGDLFVMGAFLHTIVHPRQIFASFSFGVALSALILTFTLFVGITILGDQTAGKTLYLHYVLVEQIQITDFLDRLEIFLISLWFPVFLLKSALVYNALLVGISCFVTTKNPGFYSRPFALLAFFLIVMSFREIEFLLDFSKYVSVAVVLAVQPILLLALILFGRNKREEKRQKGGIRKWTAWHLVLYIAPLPIIGIGQWYALDYPLMGKLCGVAYGIILIALCFFTFKEFRKTTKN